MAICISMAILLISLILGYVLEPNLHAYLNPVVENLSKQVETGNIKLTFHSIFSNNIRIVFFMFIFGLLCCFSALILAFNGFFVGYFVAVNSNDMFKTLLLLIPHGIFEFSSCIIACASGFVLFKFLYRFLKAFARNDEGSLSNQLYESYVENFDKLKQSIMLLLVATVLMIIAGIFEVYLTLPIANFILSISS